MTSLRSNITIFLSPVIKCLKALKDTSLFEDSAFFGASLLITVETRLSSVSLIVLF